MDNAILVHLEYFDRLQEYSYISGLSWGLELNSRIGVGRGGNAAV